MPGGTRGGHIGGFMDSVSHFVVFTLESRRFALPVLTVDRIVRAVEVTPMPDVPQDVMGVINVQGRIVPVVNLRPRLRLPDRPVEPADQFLIARASQRMVALWVDSAQVIQCDADAMVNADEILPDLRSVREVGKHADGLILVYDPEVLFSLVDGQPWNEPVLDSTIAGLPASAKEAPRDR